MSSSPESWRTTELQVASSAQWRRDNKISSKEQWKSYFQIWSSFYFKHILSNSINRATHSYFFLKERELFSFNIIKTKNCNEAKCKATCRSCWDKQRLFWDANHKLWRGVDQLLCNLLILARQECGMCCRARGGVTRHSACREDDIVRTPHPVKQTVAS